jgi:hypothetical protein
MVGLELQGEGYTWLDGPSILENSALWAQDWSPMWPATLLPHTTQHVARPGPLFLSNPSFSNPRGFWHPVVLCCIWDNWNYWLSIKQVPWLLDLGTEGVWGKQAWFYFGKLVVIYFSTWWLSCPLRTSVNTCVLLWSRIVLSNMVPFGTYGCWALEMWLVQIEIYCEYKMNIEFKDSLQKPKNEKYLYSIFILTALGWWHSGYIKLRKGYYYNLLLFTF